MGNSDQTQIQPYMKTWCTALLALVSLTLFSQSTNIRGRVLDADTGKPLAYVNVGIPERGIGTATNDDGSFLLKVPARYSNSTLQASFIGYQTYRQPVNTINEVLRIRLKPVAEQLNTVTVTPGQGRDIVRRAIAAIPTNYPRTASGGTAFYRESLLGKDGQYNYLAEGVLRVYKTRYKSEKEGTVGLIEGRMLNLRDPLDTTVSSGFSSGHMAVHRFDIVKHRLEFLDTYLLPRYSYEVVDVTYYNERPVYVIAFGPGSKSMTGEDEGVNVQLERNDDRYAGKPKRRGRRGGLLGAILRGENYNSKDQRFDNTARYTGKLYIDTESYAILRAEYEVTPEGIKKYNDYPFYSGSWRGNYYVVNYRQLGDTWYFSDALREGTHSSGRIYSNDVRMTEFDEGTAQPIPYQDRMNRRSQFVRQTGSYDENFWTDYNVLPLDQEISESVLQFQAATRAADALNPARMAELQSLRDSVALVELQASLADTVSRRTLDSLMLTEPEFLPRKRNKRPGPRLQLGAGYHRMPTAARPLRFRYLEGDGNTTILDVSDELDARDGEITWSWNAMYYLNRRLFFRYLVHQEFGDAIYENQQLELGLELNLSKQRPFYVRPGATLGRLRYARKLAGIDNPVDEFTVDGDDFNSNRVNLYYGQRQHTVGANLELAIELNPARELFVRGGYFYAFDHRPQAWFWERGGLFRKKTRLDVDDSARVQISQQDRPFNRSILDDGTWQVTVGLTFK